MKSSWRISLSAWSVALALFAAPAAFSQTADEPSAGVPTAKPDEAKPDKPTPDDATPEDVTPDSTPTDDAEPDSSSDGKAESVDEAMQQRGKRSNKPPAPIPEGLRGGRVTRVQIDVPKKRKEDERRLGLFLQSQRGAVVEEATARNAEAVLGQLSRYRNARCAFEPIGSESTLDEEAKEEAKEEDQERAADEVVGNVPTADDDRPAAVLHCSLQNARVVRALRVEGLPAAILESDLRKRILVRPGESIDERDATGRRRLPRERRRVQEFLEREGYYGAEVKTLTPLVGDEGDVDLVVRIRGGSFVKVSDVEIKRFGPLSQQRLYEGFGRMCLTGEGLLDGVFILNITSCFNRRRLQGTIEKFELEMHEAGYPSARLKVEQRFIDARDPKNGDCAWSEEELERFSDERLVQPPRCVALTVDVDAGPRLITEYAVIDDGVARTPVQYPDWL
jgi:hypothetical protein